MVIQAMYSGKNPADVSNFATDNKFCLTFFACLGFYCADAIRKPCP